MHIYVSEIASSASNCFTQASNIPEDFDLLCHPKELSQEKWVKLLKYFTSNQD